MTPTELFMVCPYSSNHIAATANIKEVVRIGEPKMLTMAMHYQMAFPAKGKICDENIRYAKSFPGVWFARRIDVVRWILEHSM
ncbi:MAG: hypothetical protein ACE5HC_16615 [Candidatus Binatia bacterium]